MGGEPLPLDALGLRNWLQAPVKKLLEVSALGGLPRPCLATSLWEGAPRRAAALRALVTGGQLRSTEQEGRVGPEPWTSGCMNIAFYRHCPGQVRNPSLQAPTPLHFPWNGRELGWFYNGVQRTDGSSG